MKLVQLQQLSKSIDSTPGEINALTKSEEKIIIYSRSDKSNVELYANFDKDFEIYLNKLSNTMLKSSVSQLLSRQMIYIGVSQVQFAGTIGGVIHSNDLSLKGIVLESAEFEINTTTGTTDNMDRCIYGSYHLFNRAVVISNYNDIKKNIDLNDMIIQYLTSLFNKYLKLNIIDEYKKNLLKLVVSVFYYTYLLEIKYNTAIAIAMSSHIDSNFEDQLNEDIRNKSIDKYSKFRDIINAFIDFGFTYESPNKLTSDMIANMKISGFLRLTSRIDYLIASIILANYGFNISVAFNINSKLQESIENLFYNQYSKTMKFTRMEIM